MVYILSILLTIILIYALIADWFDFFTHSATGPADNDPMKALDAPSSDRTVHEFEAFPPLCHRWDKHLHKHVEHKDIAVPSMYRHDIFHHPSIHPSGVGSAVLLKSPEQLIVGWIFIWSVQWLLPLQLPPSLMCLINMLTLKLHRMTLIGCYFSAAVVFPDWDLTALLCGLIPVGELVLTWVPVCSLYIV